MPSPVVEAGNGIEAMEFLRGGNGRSRVPHPRLVLLDLNMPRMGGLEFLHELRADPKLAATVVFVMTVAGYVVKHQPGHGFLESVAMLEYYMRVVEFPP